MKETKKNHHIHLSNVINAKGRGDWRKELGEKYRTLKRGEQSANDYSLGVKTQG